MAWEKDSFNMAGEILWESKDLGMMKLHRAHYRKFRKKTPECPSQVVLKGQQSCLSAHKTAQKNKTEWTKPFIKKNLSLQLDKNIYSYKNGVFSIVSDGPRIKCQIQSYPKIAEMLSKYPFADPKLFVRNGEIFIAIPFKLPEQVHNPKTAIGIDLGLRRFAATSEGVIYKDKTFLARKRKLRFLKRELQKAAMNKSKSAKRHLKKLGRKERCGNLNFTHHLANSILKTSADILVLENLSKIKAKKHKGQNKNGVSQASWFGLKQILSYKAQALGKRVVTVSPVYTSQIDSRTGLKDGARTGCLYKASDGKSLDADINAAVNIARLSKLPYLEPGNRILSGQATVTKLNGL